MAKRAARYHLSTALVAFFAAAALAPSSLRAQADEPAAVASFGDETSVTLVELPVEVWRNGEPLGGLKATDFVVRGDGREMPIVGFEEVLLGAGSANGEDAQAPPAAARRHLFLLFDLAFSSRERVREGLGEARRFVGGLDPSDLVAVGAYAPRGELVVLLSFSSDRMAAGWALDALAAAIEGEGPSAGAAGPDPLRLTGLGAEKLLEAAWPVNERVLAADALASLGQGPGHSRPQGQRGANPTQALGEGFLQRNVLNHSAAIDRPQVQERMRGHVRAMSDTIGQLVETLRGVEGRKYMALFSSGFPAGLMTSGPGSATDPSMGGSSVLRSLDAMLAELRRAGWVLHAVDLAGLDRGGLGADGLFYLAAETGGTLIEGTNNLALGLQRAVAPTAHVYVLHVDPGAVQANGAFHDLDVEVRGVGRGLEIRHREGFHAPQPFRDRPAVARLAEAATLIAGGVPHDDLGVAAAVTPLRSGAGQSRLGVVVEVPGAALLGDGTAPAGLEVYGYAIDEAGAHSAHFSYAVDLDPRQLGDRLAQGGVRFVAALDVPSRQHELRLLVRERTAGRWSLLSLPIAAGDEASELAALFLPPAADPWLVVRDAASEGFALHGRALAPAVRPSLPTAADAQLILVGHGLAAQGTALRSRVLADGKPALSGTLEVLALTPGEGGEPDLAIARLKTGGMAAGDYRLEVVVAADGVARAVASSPFRVRG
jgi:VWFA-related protein